MENKTENVVRLMLRIYVEPVEVELDQEGAILITTLQSALPGAFGLYFYENDCRASLRFDGNKLLPPGDGWKNRKYYASLGCRSFDYPFGSYANATKQFERSVNSVQRLLANQKLFDSSFVKRDFVTFGKRKAAQQDSSLVHAKMENMQQLLTSTTKHNVSEKMRTTDNKQTPLEQQFVELARISTCKDSIIEQQHADIRIAYEKLEQKERSMKSLQEGLSKLMERCGVKEKELAFLHDLNQDQKFMFKKFSELENRLMDREKVIAAQKKEIEFLVRKIAILSIGQFPSQKISSTSTSLGPANGTTVKAFESVKDDSDQNDKKAEVCS
ncbi:unnamed protein product [Onchocerca flexuosa]|uniref:TDP43_N domain-containing protein n=1 Tax=Onchocerca flexuosa TaxID=387005 RepID=A0A183H4V4_9BILA|nr:unnamed protein product [Onchocerca flexuosa]